MFDKNATGSTVRKIPKSFEKGLGDFFEGEMMQIRQRIFLALAVLWMAVIFFYSAKPADASTEDSLAVGLLIGDLFVPDFAEKPEKEQLAFAAMVDHPVRKTAHALEYALLGVLMTGILYSEKIKKGLKANRLFFVIPWVLCILYAASDEFHQTFVPGRSGQFSDIGLDSAGALIGVLVCVRVLSLKWDKAQRTG